MNDDVTGSTAARQPAGRALVLGGAGFIGSTLVDRLLADGWAVTALDGFDPFYPAEQKRRNLAGASRRPLFRLVTADTRDRNAVREAAAAAGAKVIFDLAARAGVRPSIADPETYVAINIGGLQHTLSAAAQVGARLVFASSSSVYGADSPRPFREDAMVSRPLSPYAATKVAGEALVHAHHAMTGLPVSVARLFTVYGPRQRPDLAIHSFARRLLAGEPVELYDGGRGLRDYTYVDDVVDALVRLGSTPEPWLVVNVGSDHPIATDAVVTELERALGVRGQRLLLAPQAGDVPATHADVSRAYDKLGWEPRMPFSEGIRRFCAWLLGDALPQR